MRLSLLLTCTLFLANLNLYSQCMAGFTFADNGLSIQFTDASMGGGSPVTSWSWDFDDGSTSSQQNPVHVYPEADNYDVCLTITTQNGCSDQFCFEVTICTLVMSATVNPNCDPNDQITVNVTISDPFDEAKEINVSMDGVLIPGSPFDIDDNAPVILVLTLPGDGLSHTIVAQSTEVGHCNAEFVFTAPDCGSNCFLSALNIQFAGGVLHNINVGDDFFSPANLTIQAGDIVKWTLTGDGHSTTSDATTGPDSWNSGVLGQGAMYQRIIYNPGVHPYYCIPHGGPGGAGMSAVLVANCPAGNNFTLNISFNTTQANPQGYDLLLDGIVQPGSPFQYSGTGQNSITLPLAGDGLSHTLEIRDVADPTCVLVGNVNAPDCGAAPSCMLGVSATITSGCDAANMVDVSLEVTSINGGGSGFRVRVDGAIVIAQVDYHPSGTTSVTVPVVGNGESHTIVTEDIADPNCSANTSVITENCSIPCVLTGIMLSTGTSTTHTVAVQDFQFAPEHLSITSGDIVEFLWIGEVAHTSTSDATSGSDSWDSGLLGNGASYLTPVLSEGIHPYYCIPHGAPGGIGMAGTITVIPDCTNGEIAVNVTFSESGGGFSGYQILVDGNITPGGPHAYSVNGQNNISVLVAGDGQSHQITVQDIDDPSCVISQSLITPNCNVSTCQLSVNAILNGECDQNQLVPVQLSVSSINGGANGFQVLIDGVLTGNNPYDYDASGTTIVNLLLPGDGTQHIVVIEDIDDATCLSGTNITLPDCALPCQIFDLEVLTAIATTHVVEVRDFTFFPQHITTTIGDTVRFFWTGEVAHTTTSDATSGPDSWDSGLLNNGATYDVIITEAGVHAYYCIPHGGPGGIGMAGTITALADCENGMVNVNLSFQQSGGSLSGFHILVDGEIVNPTPLLYATGGNTTTTVLVTGDGMAHSIAITDAVDQTCTASLNLTTPNCTAVPCSLEVHATIAGGCTQAGLVPVDVIISSVSGSMEGFNVFTDGIIVQGSPFAYDISGTTMLQLFLPGDAAVHQIFIHDLGDVSCTAILPIETPDCSGQCQIGNITVEFGQPAIHLVEVRDFDFFPKDITITLGDTVRFIWTGQVAHTSTSDLSSGIDSWDSGLKGNGAVYDVIITTSGTHPYYCIPHGAPGGVGMTGSIVAEDVCSGGLLSTEICFEASNGSFAGYSVLIDDISHGPFAYSGTGTQCTSLAVPGDGQLHTIEIQDAEITECVRDTALIFPDCNDPCFGFEADFSFVADPLALEVRFTNGSTPGATSYLWTFGDGSTSTLENPVHVYDSAQFYEVCLVISDTTGCTDTICKTIPLGVFICEPAFAVSTDGLTVSVSDMSVTSAPITHRIWSFGDGAITFDVPTTTHTYPALGVYDLCLSITADTCMQTICQTIDLSDPCITTAASFGYAVTEGTTVQFTDQSTGQAHSWLWGFGDGNTSMEQNPVYEYAIPGVYTVCLLIFDTQNNCSEFFCRQIQVQTTGVKDFHGVLPLILFPNPATSDHSTISLLGIDPGDYGNVGRLRIIGMRGEMIGSEEVMCEEQIVFSMREELPDGIYFVELSTEKNVYTGKLMRKNE